MSKKEPPTASPAKHFADTSNESRTEEIRSREQASWWFRLRRFCSNYAGHIVILTLWTLINAGIWFDRFWFYYNNEAAFSLLGHGITMARSFAICLKFNTSIILFGVTRNLITKLRATALRKFIPFDSNIAFHKFVAFFILLFSLFHSIAHYLNAYHLSRARVEDINRALAYVTLERSPTMLEFLLLSIPGLTGHLLLLIMVVLYICALNRVRGRHFEVFWYTHHLFIVFYALLLVHGTSGLFEFPTFWAWFFIPGTCYAIERILRAQRTNTRVALIRARQCPSRVLELQLRKPRGFVYKAGQYLFLRANYLSRFEYHPFTITSSPDEDFLEVHIKDNGDWTHALYESFGAQNLDNPPQKERKFYVDGPYGAPSEEYRKFEYVVMIGAGIGVTPFASILKDLKYKIQIGQAFAVKKAFFIWISRTHDALEWFADTLSVLEQEEGAADVLQIDTYITRRTHDSRIVETSNTHYGRPEWESIFRILSEQYPGKTFGVFYCGPKPVGAEIRKYCLKYTRSTTVFRFYQEHF